MAVTVQIPTPLRKITGGQAKAEIEAANVGALIDALETKFPGLKERILDEKGELRRFVNLYVNGNDVRFGENLGTALASGDDVSIVPAIAGGSGRPAAVLTGARAMDGAVRALGLDRGPGPVAIETTLR